MTKIKMKKVIKLRKVRQSELGLFLKLINEDTPLVDISSLVELSKQVSDSFDVLCSVTDLETFFNLENELPDENFEVESRKQQFYKGGYEGEEI